MPTEPLAGKSALVTGGARRIGRAIALALAHAGADVAITYRSSYAEAAQTAAEIAALGRSIRSHSMRRPLRSLGPQRRRLRRHSLRPTRYPRQQRRRLRLRRPRKPHPRSMGRGLRNQCARPVPRRARSAAPSARRPRPHHQHRFAGRHLTPGPATRTTAPQRPLCTCSRRPWPRHLRPTSASTASLPAGLNFQLRRISRIALFFVRCFASLSH